MIISVNINPVVQQLIWVWDGSFHRLSLLRKQLWIGDDETGICRRVPVSRIRTILKRSYKAWQQTCWNWGHVLIVTFHWTKTPSWQPHHLNFPAEAWNRHFAYKYNHYASFGCFGCFGLWMSKDLRARIRKNFSWSTSTIMDGTWLPTTCVDKMPTSCVSHLQLCTALGLNINQL
jgi:hypothetical protein